MTALQHDSVGDLEGLWDWDLATGRTHFSPRWFALIGHDGGAAATSPGEWLDRVHPADLAEVREKIETLRAPGTERVEFTHRVRHHDGTFRWLLCRAVALRDERGEATRLTGSHVDVTVSMVMDPVTRLPNRARLLDHIGQAIEHARRQPALLYALVVLDVSATSEGTHKQPQSLDAALLQAIARRLETCLRLAAAPLLRGPRRDMLARLDDDRFALLLEGLTEVSQAKHVADRALSTLLDPFDVRGAQVFLNPTAGVSVSPTGYDLPDDLIRDAESALHRARLLGGSHCEVFDDARLHAETAGSRLEQDLAGALERHELHVVYQPIVSVDTEQIVGVEALVRWQHPILGPVSPADFIPIAERTGEIVSLGRWVLFEACRQLATWRATIPRASRLWVSVNLSTRQLREPDLVGDVVRALGDAGLEADALALELTEGLAIQNADAVKTVLMHLRALGVRISVDDFGSGYSSLGYLRQLPVDTLKIDRSLVVGIERNAETTALVNTVVTMAQQLNLHVVAEGVEHASQLELLRSLRCESVQGYLFAKPLAAAAASELIAGGIAPRSGALPKESGDPVATPSTSRRTWLIAAATLVVTFAAAAASLRRDGRVAIPESPSNRPAAAAATAAAPVRPALPSTRPTTAPRENTLTAAVSSPRHAGSIAASESLPLATAPLRQSTETPLRVEQAPAPVRVSVVHDHIFGNCRGQLMLVARQLSYVPDNAKSKDGFDLEAGTFTVESDGDAVKIRTAEKAFRFRAAKADAPALQALASTLAE